MNLPGPIWFYMILAAGIATYIASKAAVDAMLGGGAATAGRLALGQWMPIAALGVIAMLLDRPLIAVGIVFSTAVACLSLASGSAVFLTPLDGPPSARRAWGMLVPAGLLAFFAGFRGEISWFNAVVLAIEGLLVLLLWNDRVPPTTDVVPVMATTERRATSLRILQFVLAIALGLIGGCIAVRGVDTAAVNIEIVSAGLMTATMISPMLVLPIIGLGSELAQRKQTSVAVSSHIGVVLLNIFALLPLLVLLSYRHELVWHAQQFWKPPAPPSTLHSRVILPPEFHSALVFPLAVWRVDVLALIALGLFLLPVSIGRWSLSRLQGLGMVFGYVMYLALSLLLVAMREV